MSWFSKNSSSSYSITLTPENFKGHVQLDVLNHPNLQKQLQLLNLTIEDLAIIKQLQPLAKDLIPAMVEQFYAAISLSQDLIDIINRTSHIDRLKITLHKHLSDILKVILMTPISLKEKQLLKPMYELAYNQNGI